MSQPRLAPPRDADDPGPIPQALLDEIQEARRQMRRRKGSGRVVIDLNWNDGLEVSYNAGWQVFKRLTQTAVDQPPIIGPRRPR